MSHVKQHETADRTERVTEEVSAPIDLVELTRLTSEPDDEGVCQDCGNYFTVAPGDESSALCHHCAQNFIVEHVPAMLREISRLRAASELVPISSEPIGDSGDYSSDCTGCGRDDLEHEHTWKECHAEVKNQLDAADGHYWEAMGHASAVTDHHGPPAAIIDHLADEIRRLGGTLPLKRS